MGVRVVAGAVTAAVMGRYTAALLFGITPLDVPSFVLSVLFIAAVVSVWLPARTAARLDPTTALRE